MKYLALLFSTTCLIFFTANGQQFKEEFSGIEEIQLSTGSADCEIVKSSGNNVMVELSHELGSDYQPDVEKRGGKLILKDNRYRGNANMKWTLRVPDNLEINFSAGSGDLEVSEVQLQLKSTTGSGDILLVNTGGTYKSNTGSGDIELDRFEGEVSLNTGSGDISASMVSGSLSMNTGSGDIELEDVNAAAKANTGSGDIDIDGLQMEGACAFNAGSGDVQIELAATPGFDLSINSGSGDAILDRNGHKLNANIVMSADKKRGDISAPYDFDREEEVEQRNQTIIKKYVSVGSGNKVDIKIGTGSGKAVIR